MSANSQVIDVFLCHTGANKEWVRDLATRLEGENVDGRSLRVFFDEWDIAPGENILSRIEDGLRQAQFLAVALSPSLTRAAWPTLEWQSQVYDDPTGKLGRIIPLVVEKYDATTHEPLEIPFALRLLRYIDFSDAARFEANFQLLLARLRRQRPERGRAGELVDQLSLLNPSAGPDVAGLVEEILFGNLFPTRLPACLYSDHSSASSFAEIRDSSTACSKTPFVLHSGRVYSFIPPDRDANPFQGLLTGTGRRVERTADLLRNPDRARHVVRMCNHALSQRCRELRLRRSPTDKNLFYPVVSENETRTYTWGRGAPLTLAKVTGGDRPLGVHHAASMRFIALGGEVHLLVEPRYFFTTDGYTPTDGTKTGRYSVKWGSKEGNWTVLRRMLMWPRILSAGQAEVTLDTGGPELIKVATKPRHGRSTGGVLGDGKDVQALLDGDAAGEVFTGGDELDGIATDHVLSQLGHDDDEYGGDDSVAMTDDQPELPF